jgi:hypothetical protein
VGSSIRVLPGKLHPTKQPSLSNVSSLVQDKEIPVGFGKEPIDRKYDIFILHAFEDKNEIERPLVISLQEKELRVWMMNLKIGDSLRQKIDKGLAKVDLK